MPPIRNRRRPIAFVVPYHRFLGPGTDIEDKRYLPPLNKLDWAAKRHDFNYGNRSISTVDADEQFYKDSEGTGLLGAASRTALKLKSALGFDSTFRSSSAVDTLGVSTGNSTAQAMDQSASTVEDTDSGQSNGWQGTSHGGALPPESGNEIRSYCVKRRFKNIVKTTDMNSVKGHFTKYKGSESTGYHNVGHFAWAEPESADYIVPYFMSTWVTPIKWEAMMGQATSYRVKSTGFTIDKIICGEWLTKNNEEVFVPNPEPYFDVFVDRGNYIGYGNLKGVTKIPNKNFTEIQPMTGVDAELPKYKYDYGMPIHLLNKMDNSGAITATNLETDVLMTHLHDWREMPEVKHVRQGDTYTHVWHNHVVTIKRNSI